MGAFILALRAILSGFFKFVGEVFTWLFDHPVVLSALVGILVGWGVTYYKLSSDYETKLANYQTQVKKAEEARSKAIDEKRKDSEKFSTQLADQRDELLKEADLRVSKVTSDYTVKLAKERAAWIKAHPDNKPEVVTNPDGSTKIVYVNPPGSCEFSQSFKETVVDLMKEYAK